MSYVVVRTKPIDDVSYHSAFGLFGTYEAAEQWMRQEQQLDKEHQLEAKYIIAALHEDI